MRKLIAVTLAVLTLAGVAACGPAASEPTPTATAAAVATPMPTATPTPTVDPSTIPARVVASATSVSVSAVDNTQLLDILYTMDAATAAAQLAEVLGVDPIVSTSGEAGVCSEVQTIYDFGGITLRAPGSVTTAADANFNAVLTNATGAGARELATINSQHVGDSIDQVLTTVPDSELQELAGYKWITMGRVNPEASDADAIGVIAKTDGSAVTEFAAPIYLFGDC